MNTISIELCEEDRVRLDKIANTLEKLVANGLPCFLDPTRASDDAQAAQAETHESVPETKPEPAPATVADAAPADEHPVDNPFPEAPAYKLADIQQKVVQLSAAGKKAEVREIVKAYAEKVSAIPEDKFWEVMAKLAGLEG